MDPQQAEARIAVLERALARERLVRAETERMLEDKTREAYLAAEQIREQQALVIQAEKMSALGRLSAGVAHEINNALNFIRGNIQVLPRYLGIYAELLGAHRAAIARFPDAAPELQALERARRVDYVEKDLPKLLAAMTTGVERATAIVRDLGIFSRGEDATELARADLREGIEVALTLATNRLKRKATVHRALEEVPPVRCHLGRLSQVFLNLLVNAGDAIADQGEVYVMLSREGDRARITIRDSGGGIAPEHQARLFEPFFTTKPPGSGTGLGLFMSKKIIDEHDGEIRCDSLPGQGTTFTLLLPIDGPAPRSASAMEGA